MPSSTFDVNARQNILYIDRYGVSTLSTMSVPVYFTVKNQSVQTIYLDATVSDPTGSWTFADGVTTVDLGSVAGWSTATPVATLTRAVPSTDVEGEQFTVSFNFYSDSGKTIMVDQIQKTLTAYIVDFRNSSTWTTQVWDFDDGTAQGWTLNGFTISNTASIEANGYSAYKHIPSLTNISLSLENSSITVPSTATVATLIFYWGAIFNSGSDGYTHLYYLNVYINGSLVYQRYLNWHYLACQTVRYGWAQESIDLTPYIGQTVDIKIEFVARTDVEATINLAVDDIILAYK